MSEPTDPQLPTAPAEPARSAGGPEGVASALAYTAGRTGLLRGAGLLLQVNQEEGFDCPGCAWPDPEHRSLAEFCENGARAVAHEADRRRVDRAFFKTHSVAELLGQTPRWLEAQGRLSEPMIRREGGSHYEPIGWDDAFSLIGETLRGLDSPNQAVFYTSGRTSNEAAFLYQLFVRQLGTNNLPDCSNMCHESSGAGLTPVIGVGKGVVGLEDFPKADAIFVIGQNPGTNHPRMLTALLQARRAGARIVAINPLRERGLESFAHPQELRGLLGRGTPLAELTLQLRVGSDQALLQGIAKAALEAEAELPGAALDRDFIERYTQGFEAWRAQIEALDWGRVVADTGISQARIREAAAIYLSGRVIATWAMGITQHHNGVANVREVVNLLLMRGNIGVPGAGPCPVRGHSNVQGDRSMGIWEQPPPWLSALGQRYSFEPPQETGFNTVTAIEALHDGRASVFFALGGNFVDASPDTAYTEAALRRCALTIQVSTKLNRSHLVTGERALILPCLGRTERDLQRSGVQLVTVEDSMSVVHRSQGRRPPASAQLLSEPDIVARLARATLGDTSRVPWEALVADYDDIREVIAQTVPGFEDYNARVRQPGGFELPRGAQRRAFTTPSGLAHFSVHPLPDLSLEGGQLVLMTLRSHDQYNTTIYGLNDRYRGVRGERRVIFLSAEDMAARGIEAGQLVDITSHFRGRQRRVQGFRAIPYDIPARCAAAYFPEANPLVPIDSFAQISHTPTSKYIVITIT